MEVLVCCYAGLGKWEEAKRIAQHMDQSTRQPGDVMAPLRAHNPKWNEQMASALRKAARKA